MSQASGTSTNPQSFPMEMLAARAGRWSLMLHGVAFVNRIEQDGPRGGDKTFSTNWLMGSATRSVGRGAFMLRSMLSLDPATISGRRYPLLFQTGETAFDRPIIDGQHPHELFMELAAEYVRPLGRTASFHVYVAPVGDPALGPVAFPHRASAMEIPQAVLGHHYQDSTHIASSVVTAGLSRGIWRGEVSVFHGAEPDEERWDLDGGKPDSWAARLTVTPSPNLTAQVSGGFLSKPEKLEPGHATRRTASVSYNLPFAGGYWASTAVWGRHYKESHDITLDAWLLESAVHFRERHSLTARFEDADKDELFPHFHRGDQVERPVLPVPTFRTRAMTLGYTFDVLRSSPVRAALGANHTFYRFPSQLEGFYGRDPRSTIVFLRLSVFS